MRRRPARPAVRRAPPRGLHRRSDAGHVPVPIDPRLGRARSGRCAPRRRRDLLRMPPRARNRRPLLRLPLRARSSGSDRGRGAGRAAETPGSPTTPHQRSAVARRRGSCATTATTRAESWHCARRRGLALADVRRAARRPSRRDERRVTDALRRPRGRRRLTLADLRAGRR
jgi:hypothetical protein